MAVAVLAASGAATAAPVCGPSDNDLDAASDGDLARLPRAERGMLDQLCIWEEAIELRGLDVGVTRIASPGRPSDTIFVVLHDDEAEAFRTLIWAVWTFGGEGLAVETGDRRYLDRPCLPYFAECDPNRIFGRNRFDPYTSYFEDVLDDYPRIVAIHTNRPDGLFTMDTVPSTEVCSAGDDPDDFILTGELGPPFSMSCGAPEVKRLTSRGLNVVYLRFDRRDDAEAECRLGCDLQAYATRSMQKSYYNTEAERGMALIKHRRQLCAILDPGGEQYQCAGYIGETEKNFGDLLPGGRAVPIPRLRPLR